MAFGGFGLVKEDVGEGGEAAGNEDRYDVEVHVRAGGVKKEKGKERGQDARERRDDGSRGHGLSNGHTGQTRSGEARSIGDRGTGSSKLKVSRTLLEHRSQRVPSGLT